MKKEIGVGCIGATLLAMALWSPSAYAQHTSWWDQQKAKNAQAATEANAQGAPAQNEAKAVQPAAQPVQAPVQTPKQEAVQGPSYSYVEGGVGRLNIDAFDIDESVNGGYVRGSAQVADNLYMFAGYDRAEESWKDGTEKAKGAIDQTEIGLGVRVSLAPSTDFISELSMLRLGAELSYKDADYPEYNFSIRDHVNSEKLMFGVRARPVSNLELWVKGGYLRINSNALIDNSAVGNVGFQYRFTPNFGLVGEAEIYKDVHFYRLGLRASF